MVYYVHCNGGKDGVGERLFKPLSATFAAVCRIVPVYPARGGVAVHDNDVVYWSILLDEEPHCDALRKYAKEY